MSKSVHQWQTYYSPRNGRVSVQACSVCGVTKGIATSARACKSNSKTSGLFKGWSTTARVDESRSGSTNRTEAIALTTA